MNNYVRIQRKRNYRAIITVINKVIRYFTWKWNQYITICTKFNKSWQHYRSEKVASDDNTRASYSAGARFESRPIFKYPEIYFLSFPQSPPQNCDIASITQILLPSAFFSIYYSLTTLTFGANWLQILNASLKYTVHKINNKTYGWHCQIKLFGFGIRML